MDKIRLLFLDLVTECATNDISEKLYLSCLESIDNVEDFADINYGEIAKILNYLKTKDRCDYDIVEQIKQLDKSSAVCVTTKSSSSFELKSINDLSKFGTIVSKMHKEIKGIDMNNLISKFYYIITEQIQKSLKNTRYDFCCIISDGKSVSLLSYRINLTLENKKILHIINHKSEKVEIDYCYYEMLLPSRIN